MKKYDKSAIYGLFTSLILITYFLLLEVVGLAELIELRFFNAILLSAGIFLAIRSKKENPNFDYLSGLSIGISTTLFAVIPFTIFIFSFLKLNDEFMQYLILHAPFGHYLNPWAGAAVVLIEGISSGIIISFTTMQYFKKNKTA